MFTMAVCVFFVLFFLNCIKWLSLKWFLLLIWIGIFFVCLFYHKRNPHVYRPLRSFMCCIYPIPMFTLYHTQKGTKIQYHCWFIQCVRKVFTALHLFHISLCNSLIPKLVIQFSSQNLNTQSDSAENKGMLQIHAYLLKRKYSHSLLSTMKYLWQQLQPQSLFLFKYCATSLPHLYFYFFDSLFQSLQNLSSHSAWWSLCLHSYFQICPELLNQVQIWAAADTAVAPKPLPCLGLTCASGPRGRNLFCPSLGSRAFWKGSLLTSKDAGNSHCLLINTKT